ncbi:hypothetical protein [Spirosoma sp. KUDC1026]|uniref:hypothetical protein n=1 Tax=Spirosoma sp. KUDC1026 TaxID=2745947 RepID=UPI00159BA789|nr:hypothetical protein [Spirosoma sp. KUDC1026]QKZ12070.1 hypothetical protein HU175_05265 [Spirosoma sp. KUDC1026]
MENNPFKEIEPEASCPPNLKNELVAEIDLIRNALQVVEIYTYDIFPAFTTFLSGLVPERDNQP